jgi:hypothetical protein
VNSVPDIVYVDNEPDSFTHLITDNQKDRLGAFIYSEEDPAEHALEPAKHAKVWLFDFYLVDDAPPEARDENGLSLFQKWQAAVGGARPTTVLISSALENAVNEPLGPVQRHHVVAQRRGVEWIGDKSAETWRRVIALADASAWIGQALIPSPTAGKGLGTYDPQLLCFDVLAAPRDAEWANSAQRQVDRARPPREVPTATPAATARAIIAWLISHVLPYPSFLITDAQAALRLQVNPESFPALAAAVQDAGVEEGYRARLAACRYTGPLQAFLGRRWWRAGVDDLAWQLSEAEEGFSSGLQSLLGNLPVTQLEGVDEPVLLFDADLVETSQVGESRDCVRVTDEDFPANVEPAWVRISDLKDNQKLRAKVIYEDRDLVEAPAS